MNSLQPQPDGQLGLAIEFVDADYSYTVGDRSPAAGGRPLAVNNVSLEVAEGEYLAIVGGNGSGKSTLSKMINALLVPSGGRVLTLGLDTSNPNQDMIFEIRSQAGLVLQNPDSQMVASVVADDVAFGPENLCVPHQEMLTLVDNALQQVMMSDYRNANPARLSGGQKQRVCIAGLLAMQPQVLVLDEPAAMLDVRGRRGIRRILRELHAAGLTVVLVTHFMEEAAQAQRIVVLDKGEVVLQGQPRDVFDHKALLRSVGLDVPFSVQLAEELENQGMVVPTVANPQQLMEAIIAEKNGALGSAVGPTFNNSASAFNNSVPALVAGPIALTVGPAINAGTEERSIAEPALGTEVESIAESVTDCTDATSDHRSPIIQLNNINFSYFSNGKETKALSDISLTVHSGEFLGVVGHTGSGKSTLLQLMAGLTPIVSGTAKVCQVDLGIKKAGNKLRSKVGVVFQYPERQLFAPTVEADIAFGPQNIGLNANECQQQVRQAMQKLELDYDSYAQRSPFELSGGEKRRVAIAGTIAMDPDVLIFDEPAAGLDPHSRSNVLDFIQSLHLDGKTIVLASHSMDTIANLCTKVLVLDHGKQAMLGTPKEVFNADSAAELRRINLGLPQATQFAIDLGLAGLQLPEGLFNAKDLAAAIIGDGVGQRDGDDNGN